MEYIFRVFDFNVYNAADPLKDSDDHGPYKDKNVFMIQIFGVNEFGSIFSTLVEGFKPFFYIGVDDNWTVEIKESFLAQLKRTVGNFYADSITDCKLVKRHKLYGFDNRKLHKFIFIEFANTNAYNKVKNLWYSSYESGHKLLTDGFPYNGTKTTLYETNIPPLLRFIHIKNMSPSGWIAIPKKKAVLFKSEMMTVNCHYQLSTNTKNIIPLNDKETLVPYKIMSFDIEADSSHGDFPVPIKTYKKLATNIIEYLDDLQNLNKDSMRKLLSDIVLSAFGYGMIDGIDIVYPKRKPESKEKVLELINKWLGIRVRSIKKTAAFNEANSLEMMFEKISREDVEEEENFDEDGTNAEYEVKTNKVYNKYIKEYADYNATIIDVLLDSKYEREGKLNELNISLDSVFPKLEGDKVTFIGSTFMNYGNSDPHMNHCIVLNSCDDVPMENTIIETYDKERDVLLAWQKLVQKENPDIVIGYNTHGFDYEFMFRRAEETDCVEDFLKLSRNKDEICGTRDNDSGKYKIAESSVKLASGQYDLKYIKMIGRLQIDLYNFYRRSENLTTYKLDYVAGYFIGDFVKKFEYGDNKTIIHTKNLTGLLIGSNIHFEIMGNSVDYYDNGAKFEVVNIDREQKVFEINKIINVDMTNPVRWCLAKDDVTHKDIFRLSNGTSKDRSIVAKYCIQDCNLVHYLFNKSDILTGYIEMSKITYVPIEFLVMRGQTIKSHSLITKECRDLKYLLKTIEKGDINDGFEGANVLKPKCGFYKDNPMACNDYASLYPSSMISENLSHDTKVWVKEFDLAGNLINEIGEKDENGNFKYDNIPGYEYVNIEFATYAYIRKHPEAKADKVKTGHKVVRIVQPDETEKTKGIIPTILQKLLKARKDTRKLQKLQTDEFMVKVLEQRQLGYKLTANSLYGGTGATVSAFYEQDIAACTTAMGRRFLKYGKGIIEECFGNNICDTKCHGKVVTKAEYIYGDTDSVFYTFNLEDLEGNKIRGKKALEITIELAQVVGDIAAKFLKAPHDFEYEKTFMPFLLFKKKKYVGMLYGTDPNECYRKEMGIILRRRDNAPIVKDIYGGIIDILLKTMDIQCAIDYLRECLQNVIDEKYPIEKLIITKSLRSGYKKPKTIAHKVLADRVASRDPGNKIKPGDRVPFVYIVTKNNKALQGEKIEIPSYIIENNLKINYSFYITNQIMNPVQQIFALVIEQIWIMQNKRPKLLSYKKDVESVRKELLKNFDSENDDLFIEKFDEKVDKLRCDAVKSLLFNDYIREVDNKKTGAQDIGKFFAKKC
jgi:DNA polymerase elongation subunit (family B)